MSVPLLEAKLRETAGRCSWLSIQPAAHDGVGCCHRGDLPNCCCTWRWRWRWWRAGLLKSFSSPLFSFHSSPGLLYVLPLSVLCSSIFLLSLLVLFMVVLRTYVYNRGWYHNPILGYSLKFFFFKIKIKKLNKSWQYKKSRQGRIPKNT